MGVNDFMFTIPEEQIEDLKPSIEETEVSELNSGFAFSLQDVSMDELRENAIYNKDQGVDWGFDRFVKKRKDEKMGNLSTLTETALNKKSVQIEEEEDLEQDQESDAEVDSDAEDVISTMPNSKADQEPEEEEPEDRIVDMRKKAFFAEESKQEEEEVAFESFTEMGLCRKTMKGLTDVGFMRPTRIQALAIPIALGGKDICASAATGSGKSAAFIVPILERLQHRSHSIAKTRVLILLPTRELAAQCFAVASKLSKYMDLTFTLCVGGMSTQQQQSELSKRPDVVIATPGRLIDHVRNSRGFDLDNIEILIMDEADRMLDEGFQAELTEIIKVCPKQRQTLLFSATMTDNVDSLIQLSMNRPIRLFIDNNQSVAPNLVQEFIRIRSPPGEPKRLPGNEEDPAIVSHREAVLLTLCSRHFKNAPKSRTIIFFPSKIMTHRMKLVMTHFGIPCLELHGSLTQQARLEALAQFARAPTILDEADEANRIFYPFLLCTDLASRGLDLPGVDWVINFSMPSSYDRYIHRVGRTARYGRSGLSTSLCAEKDRKLVKQVVKNLRAGVQLRQRVVNSKNIRKWAKKLTEAEPAIKALMVEEKEEKALAEVERGVLKAENLLRYSEEIKNRPARTWFQTEKEKKESKAIGKPTNQPDSSEETKGLNAFEEELAKELAKPLKRDQFAGLTRREKRKRMARSEDEQFSKNQYKQVVSAKRAKRQSKSDLLEGKLKKTKKGKQSKSIRKHKQKN